MGREGELGLLRGRHEARPHAVVHVHAVLAGNHALRTHTDNESRQEAAICVNNGQGDAARREAKAASGSSQCTLVVLG